MQIDLTNLTQIFIIMFATSFGTVLATKIATKLLEFIEAKTKLTIKRNAAIYRRKKKQS